MRLSLGLPTLIFGAVFLIAAVFVGQLLFEAIAEYIEAAAAALEQFG